MTKSTVPAATTYEDAEITIDYAPIKPSHESKLVLNSFDGLKEIGMLFESNFEEGKLTLCLELTADPDEPRLRELVAAILEEAYGEVAVAKAQVAVRWI